MFRFDTFKATLPHHQELMEPIKVVCGIIFKGEQIFICRRAAHKSLSGYWEFPGGKAEAGETYEDCLSRELQEELGMKVLVGTHFKTVLHPYETFTIELIAYNCSFLDATYTLTDHDAYEWVAKAELPKKKWAPADIPLMEELLSRD